VNKVEKKIIEARKIETMAIIMISLGIIILIVWLGGFLLFLRSIVSNTSPMWATPTFLTFTGIYLIICGGVLGIYYSNKKETLTKELDIHLSSHKKDQKQTEKQQ
jgi:hypothetical protein